MCGVVHIQRGRNGINGRRDAVFEPFHLQATSVPTVGASLPTPNLTEHIPERKASRFHGKAGVRIGGSGEGGVSATYFINARWSQVPKKVATWK